MSLKKVYLAAPWLDRAYMDAYAKAFEQAGFIITHKWWFYEGESQVNESEEFIRHCAEQDYQGVANADVLVVFNTYKSEGKAVEQGIALGLGIPIVGVRAPNGANVSHNVFHRLDQYTWVDTLEEAIDAVGAIIHEQRS